MKIYPKDKEVNNGKIYFIIFPDMKMYIGKTNDTLNGRIGKHKAHLEQGRMSKAYMAMRKFGFDNCVFAMVENNIPEDMLSMRERYYIDKFDTISNGYNTTSGASENGGEYRKFKSREDIKNIYEDLLDKTLTIKDIAEKHGVTNTEIGHINKGKHHAIYSMNRYPIRKFNPKTTEDEAIEIARLLTSDVDSKITKNQLHIKIGVMFDKSRKTIANIDNGIAHSSLLVQNGFTKFPLSA